MTIIALLVATVGGATLVLAFRRRPRLADLAGICAAVASLVVAVLLPPGDHLDAAEGTLTVTAFGRLLTVELAGAWLLLAIVEIAARRPAERDGPAGHVAGLLGIAAVAVAAAAVDPVAGTWVIAAGSVVALGAAALGRVGPMGTVTSAAGVRALVIASALSIAGIALGSLTIGGPDPDATSGRLAFVGVAGGLALRSAAVPLHGWAARLSDAVPAPTLAPLLAWLPAVAGVVALIWADASASPFAAELEFERALLILVGIATIGLASLASWVVDDIGHIVTYQAIAAAGLTLLGIAAIDPCDLGADARLDRRRGGRRHRAGRLARRARRHRPGRGSLPDLGGWARRSPILAVAFGLSIVALVGAPGLAVLSDRIAIVDGAIAGPGGTLVRILLFAPLIGALRVLVVGVGRPDAAVVGGGSEWPHRPGLAAPERRGHPGRAGHRGGPDGRRIGRREPRRSSRRPRCSGSPWWRASSRPAAAGSTRRLRPDPQVRRRRPTP